MLFVFFFKQKTAYEMRISDWSSDVCSSDLAEADTVESGLRMPMPDASVMTGRAEFVSATNAAATGSRSTCRWAGSGGSCWPRQCRTRRRSFAKSSFSASKMNDGRERSEEHTSELQSLMRISYAVFCLKKKTTRHTNISHLHYT